MVSAPRKPGPRPGNSREDIVRSAMRMLDRSGVEGLSFRAVARELGMTVGALSRYFKNLADLEDEVAAAIMSELLPLDVSGKSGLHEQLVRVGMDWLDINRTHPYLLRIHGPASATVIARHVAQVLKVMVGEGIAFDRAMLVFSTITNLAYAWGMQLVQQQDPKLQVVIAQAFTEELGELAPQFMQLGAGNGASFHRKAFEQLVDSLLPEKPAKKR